MPVLRDYKMGDGTTKHVVDPEYERQFREMLMESTPHPNYKLDPTYHMRKDRKRV